MKKIVLTLALMLSMFSALSAQVDGKAIGIRFGYGGELSYQHPMGNANRLELDLGITQHGLGLNGVYQWVWDLSTLADGFNWYAGVGLGLGSYDYGDLNNNSFSLGVLGQVGIEYNFNIPLQLSLDYRPGIFVGNGFNPSYDGICLAARFKF